MPEHGTYAKTLKQCLRRHVGPLSRSRSPPLPQLLKLVNSSSSSRPRRPGVQARHGFTPAPPVQARGEKTQMPGCETPGSGADCPAEAAAPVLPLDGFAATYPLGFASICS